MKIIICLHELLVVLLIRIILSWWLSQIGYGTTSCILHLHFLIIDYARHSLELLLKSLQHLLGNLKLDSSRMLLNCQCILRKKLNEHLVLEVVLLLSHLNDHVFLVLRYSRRLSICICLTLWLVNVHLTCIIYCCRICGCRWLSIRCLKKIAS